MATQPKLGTGKRCKRNCLKCRKVFTSEDPLRNRICPTCNRENVIASNPRCVVVETKIPR
jgi:hypothetical protein